MFKRIFFLILFLNISSCDSPKYLKFHDFNNGWIESETLSFEFNGDFETKMADLSFILRNNNEYPFSNIFLINKLLLSKFSKETGEQEVQLNQA